MRYEMQKEITFEEAKKIISEYGIDPDNFIQVGFKQFLNGYGDADDNSEDLFNYHSRCLKIIVTEGLKANPVENRVKPQGEPTVCEHGVCVDCKHWDKQNVECSKEFVWLYSNANNPLERERMAMLNDCRTAENFYCAAFTSKQSEPQTV